MDESDLCGEKNVELEMTQPQISLSDQVHDGGGKEVDKGGGGGGGTPDNVTVEMERDAENGIKEDDQSTPTMLESSSNRDEVQTPEVVWTLADENGDTPTKSSSEDEKTESVPSGKEEKKDNNVMMKTEDQVRHLSDDHDDWSEGDLN